MVGHDCGHGTFSDYPYVNAIVGHITHGFLLVPFWPWAKSHSKHHAYHNHKDKDISHYWFTEAEANAGTKLFRNLPIFIPIAYSVIYLGLGFPDGSHYNPFSKLYNKPVDRVKCAVSVVVCGAYLYAFISYWGMKQFMTIYFYPWLIYNTVWCLIICM